MKFWALFTLHADQTPSANHHVWRSPRNGCWRPQPIQQRSRLLRNLPSPRLTPSSCLSSNCRPPSINWLRGDFASTLQLFLHSRSNIKMGTELPNWLLLAFCLKLLSHTHTHPYTSPTSTLYYSSIFSITMRIFSPAFFLEWIWNDLLKVKTSAENVDTEVQTKGRKRNDCKPNREEREVAARETYLLPSMGCQRSD